MSYGQAGKLAAIIAAAAEGSAPVDPALYWRDDMRRILAKRNITALYLALKDAGLTQRQIAELVGQSQSEVCEILQGRRVRDVTVLERICEGLRIPRELMGLSFGAYADGVTVAEPPRGVSAGMLRRHLIALSAVAAVGGPTVGKLLTELPDPSPAPLPSRITPVHVEKVRNLTRQLNNAARTSGADPELSTAAATQADRLLGVSGPEPMRRALRVAVAELHVEAGWTGFDCGHYERAMWHYARAMELATDAGDVYLQALASTYSGLATQEHGHPNDGLKMLQFAGLTARGIPADEPRAVVVGEVGRAAVQAVVAQESATALAKLDCWDAADAAMGKARELWIPTPADPYGDLDRPAAVLELERGRLDRAEPFAVASMRRWEGGSQVSRTQSATVLATIHVRAGEQRGLQLAHSAVSSAAKLTSVRARKRLDPLVAALDARPGGEAHELARMARQVAATRV